MSNEQEGKKLTLGQKRVELGFNENPFIRSMKDFAAAEIDNLESMRSFDGATSEKHRLISLAQTNIENGCMWGVKAVFTD